MGGHQHVDLPSAYGDGSGMAAFSFVCFFHIARFCPLDRILWYDTIAAMASSFERIKDEIKGLSMDESRSSSVSF